MKKKTKILTAILACTLAVSAMGMGYASWKTDITANGNVTASGKWDVVVTDAAMETSTGAEISGKEINYEMARTNVKSDALIAAVISASAWVDDEALLGTQSEEKMSAYTYYYAVDGSKYDLSNVTGITKETRDAIVADETTITISDNLNMYYRYCENSSLGTLGTADYANASAALVVDGLINDTAALLQEKYSDTYQNYVLVYFSNSLMKSNHTIAAFNGVESNPVATISDDGTEIIYPDVTFSLPGAWAKYTFTVTNNGTVNANLANAVFTLGTEQADQLVLDAPDLSDEVLAPGESCTLTLVVEVPAEYEGAELNANGTLTIKLPYSQDVVETAPEATHKHL